MQAEIEVHRFAAQQVLHLNGPHATGPHAAGGELLERGQCLDLEALLGKDRHDFSDTLGRGRRHGDHGLGQRADVLGLAYRLGWPEHRNAVHELAMLFAIIVEKHHRPKPARRMADKLLGQGSPGIAGPNDGNTLQLWLHARGRAFGSAEPLAIEPHHHAPRAERTERKQEIR